MLLNCGASNPGFQCVCVCVKMFYMYLCESLYTHTNIFLPLKKKKILTSWCCNVKASLSKEFLTMYLTVKINT